jgi:hypothetical protein
MNEQILFNYLKENYYPDLELSTNEFSSFDCTSKSKKTRIELKCRKKHYDKLLIEKYKYFELIKSYIEKDEIPLYINSTPNGIYAFDLRNITPKWVTDNRMPKTTDFEEITPVEKTYSLLTIEQAKKI